MAGDTNELKKIAITGAAGSLGDAIIKQLLKHLPDVNILGLDVSTPKRKRNSSRLTYVKRDVRDKAIQGDFEGVDAVIHLAFIVEKTGGLSEEEIESINLGGTKNVFNACAAAGVKQVVYASSVAAYGMHEDRHNDILTEDCELRGNPDFFYSHHKSLVEYWLNEFEKDNADIKIARLRPCIFAGQDSPTRPVRLLAYTPIIPTLLGFDGAQLQLAHEEDVAMAFRLALVKKAHGAYNLTTEGALTMRDIAPEMGKWTFPIPKVVLKLGSIAHRFGLSPYDPEWLIKASRANVIMSAEKARAELGWEPKYDSPGAVLRAMAGKN
ncbi:MAG: NAD-dependent epimerase/dehydratase family protein [Pseudomonadales bacterium]|nr:NAD-dependent epimerase/dehydratase family protein [Pseudomonadales bacterium]